MRVAGLAVAGATGVVALLLGALPANATPLITLTVTDNGVLIGSGSSSTGLLSLSIATDPEFSAIVVTVTGVPLLPAPDLGTVSTDISTKTGFTGTHTIGILAKQSGIGSIPVNAGTVSFTANGVVGAPGPTTQSLLLNGTPVASFTFPPATGSASMDFSTPAGNLTSETEGISATFTAHQQDQESTIEFAATRIAIPEPLTLGVLGIGLVGLGVARRYRRREAA
jgi:hypothetical protein